MVGRPLNHSTRPETSVGPKVEGHHAVVHRHQLREEEHVVCILDQQVAGQRRAPRGKGRTRDRQEQKNRQEKSNIAAITLSFETIIAFELHKFVLTVAEFVVLNSKMWLAID